MDDHKGIDLKGKSLGDVIKTLFRSDMLIVFLFFALLVLSVTNLALQTQSVPRIEKKVDAAVKEASSLQNLIRDCQTPGTECYEFRQQEDAKERIAEQERADAQVKKLGAENYCVLEALILAPPPGPERVQRQEEVKNIYEECVSRVSPPIPPITVPGG